LILFYSTEKETTRSYNERYEKNEIEMTKKLPQGHNIGGGNRQKRRQAYKLEKKNSE
jgi:hypothetical protein